MMKIAGSGSISQRHGSADRDLGSVPKYNGFARKEVGRVYERSKRSKNGEE
jgi:hypothetical protein